MAALALRNLVGVKIAIATLDQRRPANSGSVRRFSSLQHRFLGHIGFKTFFRVHHLETSVFVFKLF